MNTHTVKAYGDELNQLTAEVARMGGLAEAQVADAVDSVARSDEPQLGRMLEMWDYDTMVGYLLLAKDGV